MTDDAVHQGAFSEAIEDFLKAVYLLQQEHERVSTSMLAEALSISSPSTTEMAKKLAKANLVVHEPYRGIGLTSAGERIALAIIRHHRLIELFLVEALGYSWDEVHQEAERLEHAISDRLAQRIAVFLGNPRYDPHGDPIPSVEGEMMERDLIPLTEWPLGKKGVVARLGDQTPEILRYLAEKGLLVGIQIEVTEKEPFDDSPISVKINDNPLTLSSGLARYVMISSYGKPLEDEIEPK